MASEMRERNDKATQTYAALGVGFVCLIVGVPLWWKTTEVYRVQLPYSDITRLSQKQMTCLTQFSIIAFDKTIDKLELSKLADRIQQGLQTGASDDIQFTYRGNARHQFDEEQQIYEAAQSLDDLDAGLHKTKVLGEHGKYDLILLPKSCQYAPDKIVVRRRRTVYLTIPQDINSVSELLQTALSKTLVSHEELRKTLVSAKGVQRMMPDKASMRSVKSHPGYEVTFTLLNPQPYLLTAEWDIQAGINEYLKPFLDSLSEFTEINVKSQYLHFSGLNIRPQKDSGTNSFRLKPDDLPHIINPIEAQLGSHVSVNPQLNFIVYIPENLYAPLQILDVNGKPAASNSFLSPQWGGIMIYNTEPPPEGAPVPYKVNLDMNRVMQVFLSQLRLLLGITSENLAQRDIKTVVPGNNGVNLWEVDHWLRKRSVENIATATATVGSLVQLLDKVKNIVINDQIGSQVQQAVESIEKSHTSLAKGKLKEAYHASRQAIVASEKAFFDPSLLELLYFPEDQKFAIYIPLFLPISIPVVMSLLQAFKWFKSRDNKDNKDKAD